MKTNCIITAVTLVREIAKEYPEIRNEGGGEECRFCGAYLEYSPHRDDCIWVRARHFIAGVDGDYPTLPD